MDFGSGLSRAVADALLTGKAGELVASGRWATAPGDVATSTGWQAELRVFPLFIGRAITIDRLAMEVVTAGTAGSVTRLGIYSDNGVGLPGNLLLDAGTIDSATTGVKEVTISQSVGPTLIWLAAVCQGAPATNPIVRSTTGHLHGVTGQTAAVLIGSALTGYNQTGITGALPASWGSSYLGTGAVWRVAVRSV